MFCWRDAVVNIRTKVYQMLSRTQLHSCVNRALHVWQQLKAQTPPIPLRFIRLQQLTRVLTLLLVTSLSIRHLNPASRKRAILSLLASRLSAPIPCSLPMHG
jgi:hypothetical protein